MNTWALAPTLRTLALLVLAVALAACGRGKEPSPITVPANAQAGDLTMHACTLEYGEGSLEAECGTLVVPENRSDPGSRLIALPVQRLRATGSAAEPVFFLWGGPGESNIKSQAPPDWMRRNHDLVAVGYRGVDGSSVLDLPEVSVALRGRGGDLLGEGSLDAIGAAMAEGAARLQREGVDLAGYTIPEVVADMEDARIGLGYERINLHAHSYGTRVAQLYSWLHPESLQRVLMLSANPPGRMVWEPVTIDAQLAHYAELCAQDAECSQRTPDLVATVRNVFAEMPARWGLVPIDVGKVKVATQAMLHNTFTANLILDALIDAEKGDPAGLALMSLGYTVQFDVPHSRTWGNLYAIAHSADYDPARDYRVEMDPPDSIMGAPYSLLYWAEADRWPYSPIPSELRQPQVSDVQTLVVAGSVDFATPLEYARDELVPYLSRGQWVVLAEAGHEGFYLQEEAFERLVTTFYETGTGDDSLFEYQPMDFSVELPFSEMARGMVRNFVLYPLLGLVALAIAIGSFVWWRRRRKTNPLS